MTHHTKATHHKQENKLGKWPPTSLVICSELLMDTCQIKQTLESTELWKKHKHSTTKTDRMDKMFNIYPSSIYYMSASPCSGESGI
jgi:hypothetical protein